MKSVVFIPIKHNGLYWLKLQFNPPKEQKELYKEFEHAQWSAAHGTTLISNTKNVVNELFAYFRAKGYYVDYSRVKSSSMLINVEKRVRK